ncbi:MAG: ATP-binding cassette domain-containing protein [Methylococcaceae bacterium]|nr:ATP-binding cassette domain-containing protein [Methylococcaceae bacterium]MCI0667760.1 ATP-binding cassette domain-containing protein [Methylococcaceae bacterium]MCI0733547.1 ATP-binding cassette domain-containing protein [Methylococcaceae bacterium]
MMIVARNLSKSVATERGRLNILNSVDLSIKPGEPVAIVGASGSGKTTLLSLLAGLDQPSEGQVFLDGECLTAMDEDGRALIRSRYVGFVFQSFHLLPNLSALENVMLPLELLARSNARAEAAALLSRVGLHDRLAHYPNQLSGGEQQRVAVARAFAAMPRVLFADEPTGNLDSSTGEQIIELLFEINREKQTTLVLVTHDDALASRCERIVQLKAGSIVDSG